MDGGRRMKGSRIPLSDQMLRKLNSRENMSSDPEIVEDVVAIEVDEAAGTAEQNHEPSAVEYNEYINELHLIKRDLVDRVHSFERLAFAVSNIFLGFQAACVTFISNRTPATCSNMWYIMVVSLLIGLPHLLVLFVVGLTYYSLVDKYESVERLFSDCWRARDKSTSSSLLWSIKMRKIYSIADKPLLSKYGILVTVFFYVLFDIAMGISPLMVCNYHHP